jgi:hypothetical protein
MCVWVAMVISSTTVALSRNGGWGWVMTCTRDETKRSIEYTEMALTLRMGAFMIHLKPIRGLLVEGT